MLIDFHTHAFPEKIAARAVSKLAHDAGGLSPQTNGTAQSLKTEMQKDGVDIAVVLSIATKPRQQTNVNDFAIRLNADPDLVAFGSVHPDAPDALAELDRIHDAGLKGVKFHPEYQGFYVDDEKMKPLYRRISQLGLVTVFHAGYDYGFPPPYHCMPGQLARALHWFDSPVVAAHWGGLDCGTQVLDQLCGENLWFDLSYGYGNLPKPIAQQIVEKHTPDKLLFGSDMPWHRPAWELQLLHALCLSEDDLDKICFRNAQKLLHL